MHRPRRIELMVAAGVLWLGALDLAALVAGARSEPPLLENLHEAAGRGIIVSMRDQKITFAEMRSGRGGTRGIWVFCNDCGHSAGMSGDQWSDDVRLSDIEPLLVCTACGRVGAEVRPHFDRARMGSAHVNASRLSDFL
jgi:hypothetical protein